MSRDFLYDYQWKAIDDMKNGCILNGGVGSGKSRTALYYYFKEQGGSMDPVYKPMNINAKDLYIITTARKRDTLEWEGELANFTLSTDESQYKRYNNHIYIDSWNNIKKYDKIYGAFFIFDEQRVVGSGAWVKAFLKIARKNKWILLSATPGDTWTDYIPVFVANGFYKNKTEFCREHAVYSRFTKYPKIEKFINTGLLIRLRKQILVNMDFVRDTVQHHEDIYVKYNTTDYLTAMKNRWNIYENKPIEQASSLCYILRRIVNESEYRQTALLELLDKCPKVIIFYNFDTELNILLNLNVIEGTKIAQWNGHKHENIPTRKPMDIFSSICSWC